MNLSFLKTMNPESPMLAALSVLPWSKITQAVEDPCKTEQTLEDWHAARVCLAILATKLYWANIWWATGVFFIRCHWFQIVPLQDCCVFSKCYDLYKSYTHMGPSFRCRSLAAPAIWQWQLPVSPVVARLAMKGQLSILSTSWDFRLWSLA